MRRDVESCVASMSVSDREWLCEYLAGVEDVDALSTANGWFIIQRGSGCDVYPACDGVRLQENAFWFDDVHHLTLMGQLLSSGFPRSEYM